MKNQKNLDYFVGFDIGTNSIGYAVSDTSYDLIKYQQHPMWGVHLFETAESAEKRRTHRAARRRLDRRQQRVQLLRELFSGEIGKVDRNFFKRINSSSLKRDAAESQFAIFADMEYTDADFYRQYPTIHHLIAELMESDSPHDVRLVYLACAWLVVHRGHFFSEVAKEKVDELIDFQSVYNDLKTYVEDNGYIFSWKHLDITINDIGKILRSSETRSQKGKKLAELLKEKGEVYGVTGLSIFEALKRNTITFQDIIKYYPEYNIYSNDVLKQVEITAKYEGYLVRQQKQIEQSLKQENTLIPEDIDFNDIKGLRKEAQQKLNDIKFIMHCKLLISLL